MTVETIVFLGPSLSLKEAQKILPDAAFHAPVRCGDIIKALRLHPKTIVIIDGFFEQTAAVWHKEILLALSLGVQVYGASSMGALRAAELDSYGMVGVGQIFEWYRDAVIIDDDEVALVHTNDDSFVSTLTPMVNVRVTLEAAIKGKIVSAAQAEALLAEIKSQPYYNRSLFETVKKLPALAAWLTEHYIDQKKLDAKQLLQRLVDQKQTPLTESNPISMTTSVFFNKIFREMIVSPFEQEYAWLPEAEKKYCQLRTNPLFPTIQRIGKLLHVLHDLIRHDNIVLPDGEAHIDSILKWSKKLPWQAPKPRLIKHLLIYSNLYPPILENNINSTFDLFLSLTNALTFLFKKHHARLTTSALLAFTNDFRQQHTLTGANQVSAWMQDNDLKDRQDFGCFVHDTSIVYYFIDQNQLGLLGVDTDLTHFLWGVDAVQYSESNLAHTS